MHLSGVHCTNVTSALEVFSNVMRYINPRFTITYFLYCHGVFATACPLGEVVGDIVVQRRGSE